MITKNDCLSILARLDNAGVPDAKVMMRKLLVSKDPSIEVLKYIAANRGLAVCEFYEHIRENHNKNKSPLYTNIVRGDLNTSEILTTLASLQTQVLLFGRKLGENCHIFYREVRAEEIARALNEYFASGEITTCMRLLEAIKTDLLVLEYINGRRELANA